MEKIWFVARRDIVYHLTKRDFYWATFGVPVLIAIITLAAHLLGGSRTSALDSFIAPDAHKIGYVDYAHVLMKGSDTITTTQFIAFSEQSAGEQALRDGKIEALLTIPADYVTTGHLTRTALTASLNSGSDVTDLETLLTYNAQITPNLALAKRLHSPMPSLTQEAVLSMGRTNGKLQQSLGEILVPVGFALAIYAAIFMAAGLLMQGIVEEKENRTLEVLLTSITTRQLLIGKIIGLGAIGLLQMIIWGILGLLSLSQESMANINLPAYVWVLALVFFIAGFLFYASLMAGIGAISPSMRELSQLTILISGPALLPVFLAPVMLLKPNGAVALTLSLVPFTAPATMMLRQALTVVPWWQTALSLTLTAITTLMTLRGAARLFRATVLLAGVKLSPRAVWRALKS